MTRKCWKHPFQRISWDSSLLLKPHWSFGTSRAALAGISRHKRRPPSHAHRHTRLRIYLILYKLRLRIIKNKMYGAGGAFPYKIHSLAPSARKPQCRNKTRMRKTEKAQKTTTARELSAPRRSAPLFLRCTFRRRRWAGYRYPRERRTRWKGARATL